MASAFSPHSKFKLDNVVTKLEMHLEYIAKDGILQEIKMIQPVNGNWIKFIYFKADGAFGFISRASLVDLEPHSLDVIKASPIGTMLSDSVDVFDASVAAIIGQQDTILKVQK